jgi:predicted dehydrogenase
MNARSLRVGMVGAGFVSQHHLMAWRTLAGQAQVVAIADPSDAAARNRAAAAIPAADHGLAVLCQKPLAPTLSEAEELAAKVAGSK